MLYIILYVTGQRGLGFRRLALRLEALSTQVQRLSRERDVSQLSRDDLNLLLQRYSTTPTYKHDIVFVHTVRLYVGLFSSFRQDQQGLARLVERELKRVSQRLDQLSRHQHHHQSHTPSPHDDPTGKAQHRAITCNLSH